MFKKRKMIRGRVFERKELLESIEKLKMVRSTFDRYSTDEKASERDKERFRDESKKMTTAINAMETILYDL